MTRFNFPVTIDELKLLTSLASDQLFRRQYIDPKMPGYKANLEELELGKELVGRMRQVLHAGNSHSTSALAPRPPSGRLQKTGA